MTDISNARTTEPGQLRESRVVHINRVAKVVKGDVAFRSPHLLLSVTVQVA